MAVNNLITLRKGIATEWSGQNPTLASGEPGYDGANNVLKIGDGATAWNDLDPIALSSVNEDGSPILGGELNLDNNDIVIDCRNETGSTIAAGTPVYVSGYYSNNGKPLIAPADASDTSKMPAFGILNSALNTDTEGTMGIMGVVSTVNTSSFGIGDVIYVASGGGLTNTKPILEDNLIQNLGRVLRVDASQGRILLLGAGRTNDVPNLDEGKIWVGSSGNTITSSTIHINETNNRVGIGTASPSYKLDVAGSGRFVHADGDCGLIVEDGGGSGVHIGDCAFIGDSAYAGIKHSAHTGNLDYMLISNGGSTLLSSKDGYSTFVRAGGNDQTFQGAFNDTFFGIGPNADKFLITSSKFIANNGNLNLDLQVKGENDDNVLYVDANNDKVGIGTASPAYKLDVAGSGSFDALNINDQFTFPTTDGSANQYLKTDGLGNVTWSTIAGGGGGIDGTGIANYVSKWADSDSLTSGIIYDDGTNVGIGTNSPSSKLDVDGTIETRALIGSLSVLQISNSNGGIELYSTTGDFSVRCNQFRPIQVDLQSDLQAAFLKLNDSENDIDLIHYQDGPTSLPNIYSDAGLAKVAIGHDSPSYKLDINGDIGLTDSGFYASPTGVMVGTSGWLYNDGQTTLSHGNFSDNGDAQNSSYVLRTSTTNATFTTIANNGSSIRLSNNRTFMFTANIVARRTNGQDNAAYKLEGIIANDGYGASILGTPVKTILYESDSSWDVQAIITSINVGSDTSDDLLIQAKGAASKNINWVCKLDLLEVGGDISGYTESNALGIQENIIP